MSYINEYIEENKDRFLEELFGLIRIPSISPMPEHKADMDRAAGYWKDILISSGAGKAEIYKTPGNPVVYAEKIIDPLKPTVMVYGHYDVMPVDPLELWQSPPFEPEIRDGKIYARGADDDKGQSFMHAKAFELMVRTGQLPCNVKFMLEGEEEIGSENLEAFCNLHKEMLKADVIIASDTLMLGVDLPSVTVGLRGLAYMQVEVTGPNRDLHSGHFGGAVANPINILTKLIAGLTDEQGRITIPGFYDDVEKVSDEERAELARAPFDPENYKINLGVDEVFGEYGFSTPERTGIRPCLDCNGIWGGYTSEGTKTIIPSKAFAKISMRLVPRQDPDKIAALFMDHFKKISPAYVKVDVKALHGGHAYVSPIDSAAYRAASMAFETAFGKKPVPFRGGGSIPIIASFEKLLGIKSILMGFGLPTDVIHSPNENFPVFNFLKGIETITLFYQYYHEEMRSNA